MPWQGRLESGNSINAKLSFRSKFRLSLAKANRSSLNLIARKGLYFLMGREKSGDTRAVLTLHFVTNQIPAEFVQAFKDYPERMKQARIRFAAEERVRKARQEQLERERPEYERTMARIKADPSTVLAKEFYGRGRHTGA